MSIELGKTSIDIGIVVRDGDAAMKFYRDTLGLEHVADTPFPGGGTMHRLMCGTTLVKIVEKDETPEKADNTGGPYAASGIRYWTITIQDLNAMTEKFRAAGYTVAVEPKEVRPGVQISMIEDPDGNWLELLEDKS
ncbi:MAG: VOC family protein [Rhodospirillaceae bacterium]|jgi:catechol 2,3-dioxygenase-like lactoylglutathione lyase family enzyme|nr:VOC family protein [Rhodospirillaceae bacterium]MBT4489983.1 VOC family protein [Rhodospirillaceae bacterium]MBT5192194.1 VOC family protein [Rhodospirillaceae bacterium]MBT5897112.1 VOC family protein [Rhodospirillaceae bacterium]MBT6428269.1 VOC family protein [Rhodospirillaceae bacterium]